MFNSRYLCYVNNTGFISLKENKSHSFQPMHLYELLRLQLRMSCHLNFIDCAILLAIPKSDSTSGYLDLVQRLEFGVDHLQKYVEYQIE